MVDKRDGNPVYAPGDLGLAIQQARLSMGLSQAELAARMGMSQRSVSEMESGKATLWAHRLFDLMAATGVELTVTRRNELS